MTATQSARAMRRLSLGVLMLLAFSPASSPSRAGCSGVAGLVSITPAGTPGNGPSRWPSVSADGRVVAFQSDATDLLPGDSNGVTDVFVRDTRMGLTERVSISSVGEQGNGGSFRPAISADGRFVGFESDATNLVPGDTNNARDVFVRDRLLGTTERVSVSTSGVQADRASGYPSISGDGRFVAFDSDASNLVPGDTNNAADVFVRDMLEHTTERVSVSSTGEQASGPSWCPSISADGGLAAFDSEASNLVPDDTNAADDVFVHDRHTGETTRVSLTSEGAQGNGSAVCSAISGDGKHVAFWSYASNLAPAYVTSFPLVYSRDLVTGRATAPLGGPTPLTCRLALSNDGQYVAYDVAGIYCSYHECYAYDSVTLVDTAHGDRCSALPDYEHAESPCLTPDSRFVGYDTAVNSAGGDVFVLDRLPDTVPPETEIVKGPCGQPVCSSATAISWRGSDDMTPRESMVYSWRLDGGAWSAWTTDTSKTLTGLADGPHIFEVKARDLSGNEDPTPARCEFTVSTTTPHVTITAPANGATVRGVVTITAVVSSQAGAASPEAARNAGSGEPAPKRQAVQTNAVQRVEFYVDGQLLCTDMSAPYTCSWDTRLPVAAGFSLREAQHPRDLKVAATGSTNGPAQICVKAFDACGRSAQQCVNVTVRNQTFADVPPENPAFPYVEAIAGAGITSGCLPAQGSSGLPFFCPYASATRAQVAVFICKAAGKTWLDRPSPTFEDVPRTHWAYGWIERFCDAASWGGNPPGLGCPAWGAIKKFCPGAGVSRQEIARILCTATGKAPMPSCSGVFADVLPGNPFCPWIERLANGASWPGGTAVTTGCACPSGYPSGAKCYCPKSPVTRGQMAVFLVRAFGITL